MPIKRIEKDLDARGALGNFPRVGKLRKGAEKTEKGSGRDLDYFRLTLEPQYEYMRPAFEGLYGLQPEVFHGALLAADSAEQAFDYWYEEWAHAKLLKRCDGEMINVHYVPETGEYDGHPMNCTCDPAAPDCKQHGRLDIVLPAWCEATGTWGKLTLETRSLYDVIALRGYMKMADAIVAQLPNLSFWSIPFTVGRAMRNVPVTMTDKQGKKQRSIKPMSLLFVMIDPEFNSRVMNPLLTAPAQRLLAGTNPETGELPDIEVEIGGMWDRDYVNAQTLHLFDHENHQANTIDKMRSDGEITDLMTDAEVIQAILVNRVRRSEEKNAPQSSEKGSNSSAENAPVQSDLDWAKDAQTVVKFIAQAQAKLGLNHGQVIQALNRVSVDEISNVDQFAGVQEDALAACIAFKCDYNTDHLGAFIKDQSSSLYQRTVQMIETYTGIPF